MATVIERRVLDIFQELPSQEILATITQYCKQHVSQEEILLACNRSDSLTALECYEGDDMVWVVFARSAKLLIGDSGRCSLPELLRLNEHTDAIAIVPKDGYTVEYILDWDADNVVVALPRLVELEEYRRGDDFGLRFDLVDALDLERVYYSPDTHLATAR